MIQIDESGWGSLLGGVTIGLYNTNDLTHYHRTIPVSYFQEPKFKKKLYLGQAHKIVYNGINKIFDTPNDKIVICRGYLLSTVRKYFTKNFDIYPYTFRKIEFLKIKDPLQSFLENKFSKYLHSFGVPMKSTGAHCMSFEDQLSWIKEDTRRTKYAKTGWQSWQNKYKYIVLN